MVRPIADGLIQYINAWNECQPMGGGGVMGPSCDDFFEEKIEMEMKMGQEIQYLTGQLATETDPTVIEDIQNQIADIYQSLEDLEADWNQYCQNPGKVRLRIISIM